MIDRTSGEKVIHLQGGDAIMRKSRNIPNGLTMLQNKFENDIHNSRNPKLPKTFQSNSHPKPVWCSKYLYRLKQIQRLSFLSTPRKSFHCFTQLTQLIRGRKRQKYSGFCINTAKCSRLQHEQVCLVYIFAIPAEMLFRPRFWCSLPLETVAPNAYQLVT